MYGISPDEVDDALQTLWHGRSGAFERLLNRQDESEPGVDEMFGSVVSEGLAETASDAVPSIANFTIRSELGRGGMGVIYEARQHHPPRDVALKVIRGNHLPDAQQKKLFEREIQSLARLKHPNVADIHEAGLTDDGRPYFAMELVQGKTLSEFAGDLPADSRSEPQRIRTLLGVFGKVCDAISYAHQRGVIHRDLKPSNIIVTEPHKGSGSGSLSDLGPGVKVVDFGLARITDADVAATVTTDAGQIRGTFAYMAPEQIQGDPGDIDIRSDVYALGVLLFEVLTGRLPYDIKHSSVGKVIRIICDTPATRPGTLNPAVRGDLETITLKALSKDRDHRYQSVSALGEDIARFLTDQPILARPHSAIYQLRKLVSRHRVASLAILAVIVVSVVGFVVSASMYYRADLAREAEAQQRSVAQDVSAFLTDMLLSLDPRKAEGKDVTLLRELADQASLRIERELGDVPTVMATLKNTLGEVYLGLGVYDKAEAQLTASRATFLALHGEEDVDTLKVTHNLATLRQDQGRMEEAEALFESTLETRRRRLGPKHVDTLVTLNSLGVLYQEWHKLDKAEPLLREVVTLRKEVLGESNPDTLVSLNNLSNVLSKSRKYAEAEAMLRELLVQQEAALPAGHPDLLVSKNDLAVALKNQNKLEQAEPLYREVLAGFTKTLGEGHLDTLITKNNLAGLLFNRGAIEESAELCRQLIVAAEKSLPADSYYTAVFRGGYGRALLTLERFDEAERELVRSCNDLSTTLGPDHVYTRLYTDMLIDLYEKTNQPDKAAKYRTAMKKRNHHEGEGDRSGSLNEAQRTD